MNDDLAAALRGFADQERHVAAASAPDSARESRALARRVVRRRAVRTGSTVTTTLVVAGGIAAGVQAWDARPEPPARPVPAPTAPAPTPTSPTPDVTPTTTPSPTATSAPPPTPTFRDAEPMSPGMLEASAAGWMLVQHGTWLDGERVGSPVRLYLVSPEGRPYVVPTAGDPTEWLALDWAPGTSRVLVHVRATAEVAVLDLLTGVRGPTLGRGTEARLVPDGSGDVLLPSVDGTVRRLSADGAVRSLTPASPVYPVSATAVLGPDGSAFVTNDQAGPRAVDADDLSVLPMRSPYPDLPGACRAWMWVGATEVLHECSAGGASTFVLPSPGSELWLVPVGAGTPRRLTGLPPVTEVGGAWRVGDRVVAGSFGWNVTESTWWDVTDGTATQLSGGGSASLTVVGVRRDELIVADTPYGPRGDLPAHWIRAVDPVTGAVRSLVEGEPAGVSTFVVLPATYASAPPTEMGD
ncbi:hypothetical protein [Cellulomonas sp. NS3]|uniref:hypothetical protein n=1 Tax=Cellulomonas sp. NS3 TaxID=2973977 RepID=UPI002161B602|nr:hypothetical protein [Cellulomonas sp. NS3]